eukprot:2067211-Heterocapsa_arctica.AAC.1
MYGWQVDAGANWEHEFTRILMAIGFEAGQANPCLMYHPVRRIGLYVHGDDFVLKGKRDPLEKTYEEMAWCSRGLAC